MKTKNVLVGIICATLVFIMFVCVGAYKVFFLNDTAFSSVPERQIAMICSDETLEGWDEILSGAIDQAEKLGIALEVLSGGNEGLTEAETIMCAVESGVDGIILYSSQADAADAVNKAEAKGIPVITVADDVAGSNRSCFVGANEYQFDRIIETITGFGESQANVCIVCKRKTDSTWVDRLSDAVKGERGIKISLVFDIDSYVFDADVFFEKLAENTDVNILCCGSSFTTLGAAQALVDRNKTSNINLIGYGRSKEILQFVRKGIVKATLVTDYVGMGNTAVDSMQEAFAGRLSGDRKNVSVYIIDNTNVTEYIGYGQTEN